MTSFEGILDNCVRQRDDMFGCIIWGFCSIGDKN